MSTISRRHFLATAALSAAAVRLQAQSRATIQATLAIPGEAAGPAMPADFVGLSYEVQQFVDPEFFSAKNTGLIRAFKALSSHGVLRLGGNTSEFSWWKPTPETPEPEHRKTREVEGEPKAQFYPVTAQAVRNLADFLRETGWACLYGINMGTNTPERAADEAAFAARVLGPSLQYFQLGNEVDLFDRHLRDPKSWAVKTYLDEWLAMARAISARVPDAKFGIPDVASEIWWLTEISNLWGSIVNPPPVTLTHHHYFNGPATNPDVNIPNLLKPETMAKVQKTADLACAAAGKMSARLRMTEGNTCYRGGKPGVSDVFASALWAADYSLLLASNHYAGINLHGGTGKSTANSVGGVLPGDIMLAGKGLTPAEIATYPHPFYSPIATFGSEYVLQPVAYGLKFAGSLCGAAFIPADLTSKLQTAGVNASAYAARFPGGKIAVILLNKDAGNDLSLRLDFGAGKTGGVTSEELKAPSLESREAHLSQPAKNNRLRDGKLTVFVPRASGLRIEVG